jgi:hypothetical protein
MIQGKVSCIRVTQQKQQKTYKDPRQKITYQVTLHDSCWNANHMLVPVKGCTMNVWNCMSWTSYVLPLWKFDHLSGHDSEQVDGLMTSLTHLKMNWGKERRMRQSVLTDGCVGTINHKDRVCAGSTYLHSFFLSNNPPKHFEGKEPPPKYDIVLQQNSIEKDKN